MIHLKFSALPHAYNLKPKIFNHSYLSLPNTVHPHLSESKCPRVRIIKLLGFKQLEYELLIVLSSEHI